MKHLVVIASGLTDKPVAEKDNRTPLQLAETPNLDRMAQEGRAGSVRTVPDGMPPGSDVSFLSLLGYDPNRDHSSAGHLVARALDVTLEAGEIPLCCDFITLQSSHNDMVMKDFTAGRLSGEVSGPLLKALQEQVHDSPVRFVHGAGHHNLMLLKHAPFATRLTPPHELIGEGIRQVMPAQDEFKELAYIMNQAQIILHNHPYNQQRQRENKDTVNSIWLWGNGEERPLTPFQEKHGKRGSVVTASLEFQGMAKSAGLKVVQVEGATGFSDTNFKGKVEAALKELDNSDVVYLHLGALEDISLKGNIDEKILGIEDLDQEALEPLLDSLDLRNDVTITVAGSHSSSALHMKFGNEDVPFAAYSSNANQGSVEAFDEDILVQGGAHFKDGPSFISALFNGDLSWVH